MKRILILMTMLSLSAMALEYNVVDRFKLMEDKYKLQTFLNDDPDYWNILGVGAGFNLDVLDIVGDIGEVKGDSAKANAILTKYNGSEHFFRLAAGLEIPLFHFEAWGVKVKPTFNVDLTGGAMLGIRKEALSISDIVDLTDGLPPEVAACVGSLETGDIAVDADIVLLAETKCGLPPGTFSEHYGQFYAPSLPLGSLEGVLSMMAKADLKSGFNFNLSKGGFFGKFGLGALFRSDFSAVITAATLTGNNGLQDRFTDVDLHGFLVADLLGGYRFGIFSVMGGLEEIKLANTMDKTDESGELSYGTPVLMRLHGQADINLLAFKVRPFVGFTNRSGYSILDGAYAGADLGFHFLKDRFGMGIRGMVDRSHVSLGVQPRLGIVQINLLGKIPVSSEVDGVKPPTMVSADLSIFI